MMVLHHVLSPRSRARPRAVRPSTRTMRSRWPAANGCARYRVARVSPCDAHHALGRRIVDRLAPARCSIDARAGDDRRRRARIAQPDDRDDDQRSRRVPCAPMSGTRDLNPARPCRSGSSSRRRMRRRRRDRARRSSGTNASATISAMPSSDQRETGVVDRQHLERITARAAGRSRRRRPAARRPGCRTRTAARRCRSASGDKRRSDR